MAELLRICPVRVCKQGVTGSSPVISIRELPRFADFLVSDTNRAGSPASRTSSFSAIALPPGSDVCERQSPSRSACNSWHQRIPLVVLNGERRLAQCGSPS